MGRPTASRLFLFIVLWHILVIPLSVSIIDHRLGFGAMRGGKPVQPAAFSWSRVVHQFHPLIVLIDSRFWPWKLPS